MNEIRRWLRALELSAHCLCEQGYDARHLIDIALHIEKTSCIKSGPTVCQIEQTIRFHADLDTKERKEISLRKREEKLMIKWEEKFQLLPGQAREHLIRENGSYWKAIDFMRRGKRKGSLKCLRQTGADD